MMGRLKPANPLAEWGASQCPTQGAEWGQCSPGRPSTTRQEEQEEQEEKEEQEAVSVGVFLGGTVLVDPGGRCCHAN